MCDPLTIALTATAIGGGVAAYGQYKQGQDQSDQYKYMSNVLDRQNELSKRTADENNTFANQEAAFQAKNSYRNAAQTEGAQKAAIAANGIGAGSVTAADIVGDTFDREKLDQIAIRYNADSKIWQNNTNSSLEIYNNNNQKTQYLKAAKNARISGLLNAGGTLLQTAGSVASGAMKFGSPGLGSGQGGGGGLVGALGPQGNAFGTI